MSYSINKTGNGFDVNKERTRGNADDDDSSQV